MRKNSAALQPYDCNADGNTGLAVESQIQIDDIHRFEQGASETRLMSLVTEPIHRPSHTDRVSEVTLLLDRCRNTVDSVVQLLCVERVSLLAYGFEMVIVSGVIDGRPTSSMIWSTCSSGSSASIALPMPVCDGRRCASRRESVFRSRCHPPTYG